MLFTKTGKTFRGMLESAGFFVALIPASRCIQDSENVQRANDVASFARANGLGVFVLEGRGATAERELVVLVVGNESQVFGFARRVVREADAAANWFLFERPGGDLVKENSDGSREKCIFRNDGLTLPDGRSFQFATAYTADRFNTAWGQVGVSL